MEIVIDTNFIITCMKNKIDLFSQLEDLFPGYKITVPKQVILELEKLLKKETKTKDKQAIEISLKMLKNSRYSSPDLKTDNVDKGILNYLDNTDKAVLGTMDRELKERAKKRNLNVKFLRIKSKKKIEIA
ncbi:MAG: PIN domain-containing protein [Nanoarchaeota archaeon]